MTENVMPRFKKKKFPVAKYIQRSRITVRHGSAC
jgi:hypothetical protein